MTVSGIESASAERRDIGTSQVMDWLENTGRSDKTPRRQPFKNY
jgi:hypothetical protein